MNIKNNIVGYMEEIFRPKCTVNEFAEMITTAVINSGHFGYLNKNAQDELDVACFSPYELTKKELIDVIEDLADYYNDWCRDTKKDAYVWDDGSEK